VRGGQALAQTKRTLGSENTPAGLAATRSRGNTLGRPPALTPDEIALARHLHTEQGRAVTEIAAVLGVSRSSIYHYLTPREPPPNS
jgi:DNA invertase Pin-like site-specific DNA recombinase